MKTPERIQPLVEEGLVDEIICQLMSGKEALIYVVRCGEHIRCAKVYKEFNGRSFRQSFHYTEGRGKKAAAAPVRWIRAPAMDANRGKMRGRALNLTRYTALPPPACLFLSLIIFMRVCC